MEVFPSFPHPPDLKHRPLPLKMCGMCRRPFNKTTLKPTKDHVIPAGWFSDTPPKNLPTWSVCESCQDDLDPREERLRNIFAGAHSHEPQEVRTICDRSVRSKRTPVEFGRKMVKHPLGFEVPASIAIPNEFDLHVVFRKITTGLYWWREGKLPTDNRFIVRIPNAADFDMWTKFLGEYCPVQGLGAAVRWMSGFNREETDWNVWLFNIFGAVPVGVWQGNAVNFPLPNPAGVVLRDDAPFITPGLIV